MIKKTGARIVYNPIDILFGVEEKGGSPIQKYDANKGIYVPDRTITPYVLTPYLRVTDPDGLITSGDKTSELVNCKWFYNDVQVTTGSDFTIGEHGALTVKFNLPLTDTGKILQFTGEWLDIRRQEVYKVEWQVVLGIQDISSFNLNLMVQAQPKTLLIPMKDKGEIRINLNLYNGKQALSETEFNTVWKIFDKSLNNWRPIDITDPFDAFCNATEKSYIIIDQKYVENVLIKAEVTHVTTQNVLSYVFRMKRHYGQYEENIEIIRGKYITTNTRFSEAEAKVTNKRGDIVNPENYFDIGIFFKPSYSQKWLKIAEGTHAIVEKDRLGMEYNSMPQFGVEVREKTAFLPLIYNNKVLCDESGNPLYAQVPEIASEI